MSKILKEQILELRNQGHTYQEIADKLGCVKSSVCYHIGHNQKEKTKNRSIKYSTMSYCVLSKKLWMFKSKYKKDTSKKQSSEKRISIILNKKRLKFMENDINNESFSMQDLVTYIGENPKCYLTGQELNLSDPNSFHFDHIVPISKGGTNNLDNLGLCIAEANFSKRDMTVDRYLELCKSVLLYNGYKIEKCT